MDNKDPSIEPSAATSQGVQKEVVRLRVNKDWNPGICVGCGYPCGDLTFAPKASKKCKIEKRMERDKHIDNSASAFVMDEN